MGPGRRTAVLEVFAGLAHQLFALGADIHLAQVAHHRLVHFLHDPVRIPFRVHIDAGRLSRDSTHDRIVIKVEGLVQQDLLKKVSTQQDDGFTAVLFISLKQKLEALCIDFLGSIKKKFLYACNSRFTASAAVLITENKCIPFHDHNECSFWYEPYGSELQDLKQDPYHSEHQ